MNKYKLVPVELIERAAIALERFANDTLPGRNAASHLRDALAAAPAVQGEPVGEVRFELGAPSYIFAELYSKSLPVLAPGTKLYTAPQPAEQQPCPEGVREGAPYDDPAFEAVCREYGIWGTAAAAQCAVFWEAGKRVAEQKQPADGSLTPVPDELFAAEFNAWWEQHGQFCRAGGGDYERTFAFEAWRHLYPRLMSLQKLVAEQQPAPDVAGLVEALEALLEVRVVEADASYGLACAKAEHALAPYRKGGDI